MKTTSPEKYRVRPSSGKIKAGSQVEVVINLQQGNDKNTLCYIYTRQQLFLDEPTLDDGGTYTDERQSFT